MAETPEDTLPPEGAEAEVVAPEQVEGATTQDEGAEAPPPSLEDIARDLGWKPEGEWKGPKDNWTPADQFIRHKVEKGDRLAGEVREVRQTVDRLARTSAIIVEKTIAEQRAELERQFAEAVAANDSRGAWEASQALARADATPEPVGPPEPVRSFHDRNPWFAKDEEAQALAHAIGERATREGRTAEEQVRMVEEGLKRRFPEHFAAATPERTQRQAPIVGASQSRASRPAPRERGAGDLPSEARKAGEDFVRRGRVKDLAEYARYYFEENA